MRVYYVALSRAEELLIVPNIPGRQGVQKCQEMLDLLKEMDCQTIEDFDMSSLPEIKEAKENAISKPYSYTADYLLYTRCPRQYMIFRKYGLAGSRTQTMVFGSLVHSTIEDLHHELINRREQKQLPHQR